MSAVFLLATSGDPLSLRTPPPARSGKYLEGVAHSSWGDSSANRRRRLCARGCRDHFRWLGGACSRHGGRDLVFLGWGAPWWSLGLSQGLLTLRRPSGSGQEGEWVTEVVQAESVKQKRTIFLMVARRAKETPCRTMPLLPGLQPGGAGGTVLREVVPLAQVSSCSRCPCRWRCLWERPPPSTPSMARRSCYPAPSPAALASRTYTSGGPTTAVTHTRS